ncbi:MAG: hypothetical protein NTV82_15590 [Candidatus Aminicenantes bacterium]|nr:hypothetical protein [Candidatus Aminicenantes bacterium]
MSRPKSFERIMADIDKSIRKERRERKRQEREARRKVRLEKQRVRENIAANGVPKVQPSESRFGLREVMEHSPLVICGRCHRIIREREFIGGFCESCHYSNEGNAG